MNFTETGLQAELLQATEELGYVQPTAIQQATIPSILETEADILALAQTGTGKTAAFGLPLIQLTDTTTVHVQTIVLCPTRELCIQITKDLESYSKYVKGYKNVAVYGGADIRQQINSIKKGCHTVVGTPGRVMDLIRRRVLNLSKIKWVVLDEADEMLNMGFKEDLNSILSETPDQKRVLLFSATLPKDVASIARKYMNDPKEIAVGSRNQGAENVRHEYYVVQAKDRYAALKRIADIYPNIYGIVFCRTRKITREIAQKLIDDGYNTDALHGELSQAQRDQVMSRFRQRQVQLLIATDVAARGLDVNDLTHVINYDLPDDNEVYIHRTGRTARAGKSGVAISIIHTREQKKIREIQKMTGKKFVQKPVPTGMEVCEKQLFNLIDNVEKVAVDNEQIGPFMPVIYKKLEWLSREELIKHFVSVEFNRFLSYSKNRPDINIADSGGENKPGSKTNRGTNYVSLNINLGRKHGMEPAFLIDMINHQIPKGRIPVGRITVHAKSTSFEVDPSHSREIFRAFRDTQYDEIPIRISKDMQDPKGGRKIKRKK
jgi:ATP-dependent RNA helicase DeaD